MPTPILSTKLYIPPPQPDVVLRPRLIALLNEGLHHRLTLISAPAGFGKTTLVSEWAASGKQPMAWLSLDERDNDIPRFLTYLIAALQSVISEKIGKGLLEVLQSPQPPPIESLLTALLNEISAQSKTFAIVLDDYHMIDSKPIDHALTFLLEYLPVHMHLFIATREDPHLPLARLRARGQLTELRAADLRFTSSEAAEFVNQVMGLTLSTKEIAALETRTEGWIAGLQLAALSMQGQKDITGFITSFTGSHRFVMDYLVEEVLQKQSQSVKKFLLHTSILDRLCGPLCDAVLSEPTVCAQETLEHIEHANLFIIPLDHERRWYRYHHLFADLLQQRLHQIATSPDGDRNVNLSDLHNRASDWYEANNFIPEAIQHALSAGNLERAADLVESSWAEMDQDYQASTWLDWVKALPEELIRARPVLSVGYAWALLDEGELDHVETLLQDAERWLSDATEERPPPGDPTNRMVVVDEEQYRSLPATIADARATCALFSGDLARTLKYAEQALDLVPEENHFRRGAIIGTLAVTSWMSGDLETAHRSFTECMANLQKAGKTHLAISITFILADMRCVQGRLREAIRMYGSSLQNAAEFDRPVPLATADLYIGLSMLNLEQNDLDTAIQNLLKSEEMGRQAALPDWQYRWHLAQARIKETQGNTDGALELLDKAEHLHVNPHLPDIRPLAALKARLWVRQGRLAAAQEWVQERGLSVNDDLSFMQEFEHITLARIRIAEYRVLHSDPSIDEAMQLLERLGNEAEHGGRLGSLIEILVLLARVHRAQDNIPLALEPLSRALTLAEPEGYVNIFVSEGIETKKLLSEAAAQKIMPDYVSRLLAGFEPERKKGTRKKAMPPALPTQTLIEPLSKRELEVLRLIARGLTNQEIGDRLFVALDTVKGHNRNIFGKLQVQRRTEAVARGRDLGLL